MMAIINSSIQILHTEKIIWLRKSDGHYHFDKPSNYLIIFGLNFGAIFGSIASGFLIEKGRRFVLWWINLVVIFACVIVGYLFI